MIEQFQERWGRQVVPCSCRLWTRTAFTACDLVTRRRFCTSRMAAGAARRERFRIGGGGCEGRPRGAGGVGGRGQDELMESTSARAPFRKSTWWLRSMSVREDRLFPVLYTSGLTTVGTIIC